MFVKKSGLVLNNLIISLIIITGMCTVVNAENNQPTFEHLSLEKGISHNLTRCIMQDSKGFMWFGTMFGLIKFDGINYSTYQNHPGDSLSLSHDDILCMIEDRNNYLWIGTRGGGLNRFNQRTKTFIRFYFNPDDSASLSNNFVNALCEDSLGNLWIGTDFGLNKLDRRFVKMEYDSLKNKTISFNRFMNNLWDIKSISNDFINSLSYSNGHLWIGTKNGLNIYNPETGIFNRYFHQNPLYTKVYDSKIFELITRLKYENKIISAIIQPGHYANKIKEFYLTKKTIVLIYCQGEGKSELYGEPMMTMFDYGYIEKISNNTVIWRMDFHKTKYGGGAEKNRIQIETIVLDQGRYRIGYKSDDSHAYNDWNNTLPKYADDWGIFLFKLDRSNTTQINNLLKHDLGTKQNSVSSNYITSIVKSINNNQLWIGTNGNGLNKFDLDNEIFEHYLHDSKNENSLINNNVNTLFEDNDGILWIGTSGGISRYDEKSGKFTSFSHDPLNTNSISSNFVYAIYKDLSDILWCGTYWGGIDKLDFKAKRFDHIQKNISSASKLAENNFHSILEINSNLLLIGTWGDGLVLYDRKRKTFTNYHYNLNDPNSVSNNFIRTIYKDQYGNIWIGTYGGGLNKFDIRKKKLHRYYYDSRNPNSISSNSIVTIYQDSRNMMWIGTEGGGLNKLNPDHKTFTRFQYQVNDTTSISSNDIYCIYEDDHNVLWIGTASGLDKFDVYFNQFDHYLQETSSNNFLSNNYVYAIQAAKNGRDSSMWVGTASGLYRFDTKTGRYKRYTEENGLPNRVICGILEDDNGFLWLSTNRGLSRFDPKMKIFSNYDVADGLQSNMFNIGAFCKFNNGELGFAGINGLNIFHPENIISNTYVPPVYITGLKKIDQPMNSDIDLTDLSQIELSYDDNYFTIEFVSLDFSHPEKNRYAYKLEGADDRWIHSEDENFARYTNIDPGKYIFKVRGTNNDGVWNMEGDEITIVIKPPFWMTWWFNAIIISVITLSLVFTVYVIIKREKQKTAINKKISELKLQALQAQMNPHFIFNTINAIQYFISKKDNDSAYFYLTKFSRLLRRTLENSEKLRIPLEEEFESLKLYLELQSLRYGNKFSYHIAIDPEIDLHAIEVPSMVFQPYIENAIQHGFSSTKNGGKLEISVKQIDDMLVCNIVDDGVGIKKSLSIKKNKDTAHTSSGMKLTAERLEIINAAHKDNINVSIKDLNETDKNANGTQVTLQIPV